MPLLYDTDTPKKATNVSINSDLLRLAKQCKINLSATLEKSLIEAVRQHKEAAFLADNQSAIQEYNARIEKHGLFHEGLRQF